MTRGTPIFAILLLLQLKLGAAGFTGGAERLDYLHEVRPILARNCFACHGADDAQRMARLRLDERDGAIKPRGAQPAAIVPGQPERSPFVTRVLAPVNAGRMPPPGSGHDLTTAEIARLRRWIKEGAAYAPHWAFKLPSATTPPKIAVRNWARNPIDHFILARLSASGLQPNPRADKFALLRRVSLDLRGLPPTPREMDEFARDDRPEGYERWVDRFLHDPAFGERWARMWLDLARYADSAGLGSDPLRLNIWPYRDWVIAAFNRNLPYDQFTVEQLAGDLLPDPTPEQRMATAFHRNTMTNTEGGTDDEEFRVAAVKDRIETTLQVWMGLTLKCAQCHTHKFDPIANREYYSIFAIFNQTADHDQPDERPTLPIADPTAETKNRELEAQLDLLRQRLAAVTPVQQQPIKAEIDALQKQRTSPTPLPVMVELPRDQQRTTHLMIKGNFLVKGDRVEPGVPAAFHRLPANEPLTRLTLARWLLSPDNPLTARVAVNRFWAQVFGVGLVETEEDFGSQGELPSHPALLDWLAESFSESWDTKHLLRMIVTSATYRQSTHVTRRHLARDPQNRLLARAPRVRLEAEMVRDQALTLSGQLSHRLGGPSVYPPQPEGMWQAAFNGQRSYPTSTGGDRYRRGLYTIWRRTVPYPSMATFDAPSRETCSVRRSRTNTPLQAFVTLNDPVYVELSQALARRIVNEGGTSVAERAVFALRLCLCRPPSSEQVTQLVTLFEAERTHFATRPEAAQQLATEPLGPLPVGLNATDLAAWTVVANVLLNLDSVMTKG